MATTSAYLETVGRDLWAREIFTFIPDRDLPPPPGTIAPGDGPRVAFAGFPSDFSLAFLLRLLQLDVQPAGIITSPGAHPAILGDNGPQPHRRPSRHPAHPRLAHQRRALAVLHRRARP